MIHFYYLYLNIILTMTKKGIQVISSQKMMWKNSLDRGSLLLGFDWKANCSLVSGPETIFSHTTACATLNRTGLIGSRVRISFSGFIETKNLDLATHQQPCAVLLLLFFFKSLLFQRCERSEEFDTVTIWTNQQKHTPHSHTQLSASNQHA